MCVTVEGSIVCGGIFAAEKLKTSVVVISRGNEASEI